MQYTQLITSLLEQASHLANTSFGKVTHASTKLGDNNQVLTETDLAVGRLLVNNVKETYPAHNIIDEETGVINNNSAFTWVIDPIDGTSNFANGVPTYGIMIGLLNNDQPIAGGIALPYFSEIIIAEKGEGTFANEEKVHVTEEIDLMKTLIAYGIDGHQKDPERTKKECTILANIVLNIRNLRTSNSAYDAVMVAKGKYGGMLNQTSKIWDNVAWQIVIEEAGGVYTDYVGKPMDYANALARINDNYTVCASAPALHKKLQEIIHKAP